MSKFIIDSMLPKYHQQYQPQMLAGGLSSSGTASTEQTSYSTTSSSGSASSGTAGLSCNSPPPPPVRMYPYVHGPQTPALPFGAPSMTAFSSMAAVVDAADKSCRYNAGSAAESMAGYSLHHQNGVSVSAASASMAAAAQFYHQAAAASAATDPLTSCATQVASASSQPMPDIPRYPWMSITGKPIVSIPEFGNDIKYLKLIERYLEIKVWRYSHFCDCTSGQYILDTSQISELRT